MSENFNVQILNQTYFNFRFQLSDFKGLNLKFQEILSLECHS